MYIFNIVFNKFFWYPLDTELLHVSVTNSLHVIKFIFTVIIFVFLIVEGKLIYPSKPKLDFSI